MKTCIYGAGAIGGWLGVKLAQAGCELSAVARGATLDALRRDGLTLLEDDGAGGGIGGAAGAAGSAGASGADRPDADGHAGSVLRRTSVPIATSDDPAALGAQDLVVLAVKAPALAGVAARIAPLLGPDTVVLTAMNGVPWWFLQGGFGGALAGARLASIDPDGAIAAAIPARHVVGGVVHASCSLAAPGVARRHFGNGLIVGEPAGGAPDAGTTAATVSPRLQALHALLLRAGIDARVSPCIQRDVWYKLWGNMTINPVSLLTGATTDRIMDDPLLLGFVSAVMREAREVGARIGLPIAESPEDRHAVTRRLGAFKTSMLQDVEAGRAVELDALVGAVRELGQLAGVETPFTDALFGLARVAARARGLY